MKLIFDRSAFLSALTLANAARATGDKAKPILRNVLCVAGADGSCDLAGTDTEQGLRVKCRSVEVQRAGRAMLPADKLAEILREARDERMSLDAGEGGTEVSGLLSPTFFEMPFVADDAFPDFPSLDGEAFHEVSAGTLRGLLRRTTFACADDESRYTMSCSKWETCEEGLRIVATDGRRLALVAGLATGSGGHKADGMVPAKALKLLEKLLDDPEEPVRFRFTEKDALFSTPRATLYTQLTDGRFPAWKDVVPKKHASSAAIGQKAFMAAVRQAAIMADKDSRRIACAFGPQGVSMAAAGAATGRSKVECPLDGWQGPDVAISFNPDYLIDFLKSLPPDAAPSLEMTDGGKPALFRCADGGLYLVMPLT